jgi:4-amino-4-deoxy-L-arabinose transferase-like glycosyltransferase
MPAEQHSVSPCAQSHQPPNWWTSGPASVLYIASGAFAAQLATAFRYGIFRDELYFIDCSRHLAWGYVDQPPLIALIAWLERHLTGDSLLSLRFLPALAGALTVWLAGKMARGLGGCRYAQILAALGVLLSTGYLAAFHLLTMNAFEPLIWTACAYVVLRIVQTGNQKLWLWFGLIAGVGLENKYGMLFFGLGVFLALLVTPERKAFMKPWIWLGGAASMLIWLPNLIWNFAHHWPFLELVHNIRQSGRDVTLGALAFLLEQAGFMNPMTAPIWIGGLAWLLFGRENGQAARGRYRVLGFTFILVMSFFIVLKGKAFTFGRGSSCCLPVAAWPWTGCSTASAGTGPGQHTARFSCWAAHGSSR